MYKQPPSLKLLQPSFGSPLVSLILELEKLRDRRLQGSTPPYIFFQLKSFFHSLESLASARIEGNHTTVAELVEAELSEEIKGVNEEILEINNMRAALAFIEDHLPGHSLNHQTLWELHKLVVKNLSREGDKNPGEYRKSSVTIQGSSHLPPDGIFVRELMDDFLAFLNRQDGPQFDLIKVALAHHAFAWIHPFGNGNGRTVRLVTYAMLIRQQFNVHSYDRIINPAAIFCNDRTEYYNMLQQADSGTAEGLENWCMYVLSGLKRETEKIDRLADFNWLKQNIWLPAVEFIEERKLITREESMALKHVFSLRRPFKAQDLVIIYPGNDVKIRQKRTYMVKKMQLSHLIVKSQDAERSYVVNLSGKSPLLRGLSEALGKTGFIPASLFEKI